MFGLIVFCVFLTVWSIGARFAMKDNFFTVKDMQSHGSGFERGIPLIGHMGCLMLDLLPFPGLVAIWAYQYSSQWNLRSTVCMLIAGFILSAVMHYSYIKAGEKFPEFVTYGGRLTAAGMTHVVYMGLGFAILGLAYFFTQNPNPTLVWVTTAYLILHVTIGVHVIHKILKPSWFPYHDVLDAGTLVPIGAVTILLLALTWNALR